MERGSGHNDKLDLWKCVAIYSVIFIHILLPGQIGVAVNCLARFAVPLFFLSAGFFSWRSPPRVLARRTVRHRRPAALRLPRPAESWVRHGQTRRCLHGCLPSGALYLGQRSIAGTVAALSPALLLAAVVSGRAADDLPDVVGPHRAAPEPPAPPPAGRPGLGLLAVHLVLGEGRSLQGLAVDSVRHPKRVAGRPALLPPGHLDGIAAGADRGPAAGLALAGGGRRGPFWRCGSATARNSWTSMWGRCWAAVCVMAACVAGPAVKSPVLRRTACRCGRELTFYIFAFHVPIYGVMKEWSDTVPGFAWAMERSWLLPFLVAVLSTLLAIGLNGGAAWLRRRIRGGTYEDH